MPTLLFSLSSSFPFLLIPDCAVMVKKGFVYISLMVCKGLFSAWLFFLSLMVPISCSSVLRVLIILFFIYLGSSFPALILSIA